MALVVAMAVVASGCTYLPNPLPERGRPASQDGRSCSVSSMRSCGLPFPSDEFTVADSSTATGRRVDMPADLLPDRLVAALGPGATPADASRGADGYSVLTPVMFELDRAVNPASIPADGGEVVAVFDEHTGERVPIRVEVPAEAIRHGAPETIVVAWPQVRYEFGHTYVARLTDSARARTGSLQPAPGLADREDPTVESLASAVERLGGDRWEDVLVATRFTVRSESNATHELDAMNAAVRAQDHPVRNLRVDLPLLVPGASAVVVGEVSITDFRDEHGTARIANGGTARWVPFTLVLPETPAGPEGAPVVIYGHGLLANKETMLFTASTNAQKGLATIGIDVPNHGSRQAGNGGYLLELNNSRDFGRLASMPLQGVVDHVSLLLAVQHHLGDVELTLPDLPGRVDQPAPRLDVDHLLYEGTSMGGVLGAAFTALAPELEGSFLQVAGTGIADTIFHSLLWILFMGIIPSGASTGDAYALMGAATLLTDPADNVNVLARIRDQGTPVFLAYGVGDGVVPNYISDRMIALLDLPLVGHEIRPVGVPRRDAGDAIPADGNGF
ncbi:MAG: alpha/beta hydrolase family protein, partial [Microthrixaceae bacterium]